MSGVAVRRKRRTYSGRIFYIPQAANCWLMHFVIVPDLELCLKDVKRLYSSKGAEDGPSLCMTFDGDEVSLDIPEEGIALPSGWSLLPLSYPPKLLREDVDSYQPGRAILSCQIELVWTKEEKHPQKLEYKLHISGVRPHGAYITITRRPINLPITRKSEQSMSPERAQEILQRCLEGGYLNLSSLKGILSGKARSGKTHTKCRLFNMEPPSVPISTGVAEGAVRGSTGLTIAGTRGISHDVIQASLDEWFQMSPKKMKELLATAIRQGVLVGDLAEVVKEYIGNLKKMQLDPVDTASSASLQAKSPPSNTTTSSHTPSLLPQISTTQKEMAKLIEACPAAQKIFELQLLHFVDSGGQPQFHEVLPAFIHNTALIILVLKLNEPLDAYSEAEFCDESGVTHKEKCTSLLSNEEILEHQVRTLQAKPSGLSEGRRAVVVVVGTHRDEEEQMIKEEKCKETRAQKNRKLRNILLPWLLTMLIMFRPPDEIIFPINMLNPSDDDRQILRLLRQKIMEAGLFSKSKIPVGWFMLEQDILNFAKEKNRKVVLVLECVQIAANLKIIDPEILEAALLYFHSLNVFMYCPNVLPGLVFTDPQVPLDCVFEFVAFQFKVSCGAEKGVKASDVEHLMKGIVTMEMIRSKTFSKCFIPGLYGPEEAIKLFQSLFIAAPLGNDKYLMPFLLPVVSKTDLHKHIPTCTFPAPLLILFRNKSTSEITCVPNGVFCGLVAYLLSKDNWDISRNVKNRSIECMARNIVILSHRRPPAKITIVNMQAYFDVFLEADERIFADYCPELCQKMFVAVKHVLTTLKYSNSFPCPAFQCTCSNLPHAAEPDHYKGKIFLSCTKESGTSTPMEKEHIIWKTVSFHARDKHPSPNPSTGVSDTSAQALSQSQLFTTSQPSDHTTTSITAELGIDQTTAEYSTTMYSHHSTTFDRVPTMQQLIRFKIFEKIGSNYEDFGILLLGDEKGAKVKAIVKEQRGDAKGTNRDIFRKWLHGEGATPVSWRTLLDVLNDVGLKTLARDITNILQES